MAATQNITGLSSGFDTQSIVDSLMSIEKQSYNKLDVKKQTEELKLQAYQAVNSMLLAFRTNVKTLSTQSTWKAKSATSTNENILKATANQYAVNGSYSFKVAQLATASQFMSKGFSSSKAAFVATDSAEDAYKLGSITLNSSKARVDTSAKLDTLNGGKGVYRGSVRVTDAAGHTSVIDLSTCDTMDDVARTLSSSTGAQIKAEIKDGKLMVTDESNGTGGTLKIQNVGSATTATDLGIVGSADASGVLTGRNVYTLGSDLSLSLLNDGLGVEEGTINLMVSNGSTYYDLAVSVNDCETVGDVLTRVNSAIEDRVNKKVNSSSGGSYELLDGLRLTFADDKTGFALSGTKAGTTYQFYDNADANSVTAQTPAAQLGLAGKSVTTTADNELVSFNRCLGAVDSPMLKTLKGANGTGIGGTGTSSLVPTTFSKDTLVSALNSGQGVNASMPLQIRVFEGGEDITSANDAQTFYDIINTTELANKLADKNLTIGQLTDYLNETISKYAADPNNNAASLAHIKFVVDENNQRLNVEGLQGGYTYEIRGTLANSLGTYFSGANAVKVNDGAKSDLSKFYSNSVSLIGGNDVIEAVEREEIIKGDKGEEDTKKTIPATTLKDLDGLLGSIITDYHKEAGETEDGTPIAATTAGDIEAALKSFIEDADTMKVTIGANEYDLSTGIKNRLTDKSNNGTDYSNVTATDFINAINDELQAQMGTDVSAPKLKLNATQKSYIWSNVDFAIQGGISVTGKMAEALGVKKNIDLGADYAVQNPQTTDFSFNPATTGYVESLDISGSTTLKQLNNGAGLTFSGKDDDAIEISLGTAGSLSITKKDLIDAMAKSSHASAYELTLDEYAATLNSLVATKLQDQGFDGDVSLKFAVGSNGLVIKDVTGAKVDSLKVSGALAAAAKSGIGPVSVDKPDASKTYTAGELKAGEIQEQTIEGIGNITLKLGNSGDVTLNTNGLNEYSSLSDLVNKLNEQLANKGGDYANISFTINDAGTGLAVSNNTGQELNFVKSTGADSLAADLGLVDASGKGVRVDAYSHNNLASLNRQYMARSSSLKSLTGLVDMGAIKLTNAFGTSTTIDMSEAKTVGDVIDAINMNSEFGIFAQLNATGDGIDLIEAYSANNIPSEMPTGNIKVEDVDGGELAAKLGIAGTGQRDGGYSRISGTQRVTIDVMSSDTLETLMYRISEKGGYKTAVINDGSATNPYRLTITSSNTGEASDFVIDTDLDFLGLNQTARGTDAKVLYGSSGSSSSPIMLSSATNSNSTAILGLTLELKNVTEDWITVNVDTDKESVVETIKEMVQSYNDLNDLISYLDDYDEETGEPGVLFGDNNIRKLMEDINEMFYLVFNPNNLSYSDLTAQAANKGQQTFTWMDMGLSLSAKNTSKSGDSWYSTMELDLDALDEFVASKWDTLYQMLAGQRNSTDTHLEYSVRPTATFNGKAAEGYEVENAINGDSNSSSWGIKNGFMADGTIAEGENQYSVYFQSPVTASRMSIYHLDSDTALKNFTIEYLDANTGKWETFREVSNNGSNANHLGFATPTAMSAVRITANSTNAEDGKFRLLDLQVYEDIGLVGKLNALTESLADTTSGWLFERDEEINSNIDDLTEQMEALNERLEKKEESLWRKFNSMESALGTLQNQSTYFSTMMDSMSSSSSSKKK